LRRVIHASAVSLTLLVCAPALASSPTAPLSGDEWRYQQPEGIRAWLVDLLLRSAVDVPAIPLGVGTWEGSDWALASLTTATTVLLAVPFAGRSTDARIQDGIHVFSAPNCQQAPSAYPPCVQPRSTTFHLWTPVTDPILLGLAAATPFLLIIGGAIGGDMGLVEVGTLAIEALIVMQVYQVALKLLTGREPPLYHNGSGTYWGPTRIYFPGGFPSGHAAALFTLASVFATYYDLPWLSAVLYAGASVLSAMVVIDDLHFTSEVIFGAVLGTMVGRWVVHHRSSRGRDARVAVQLIGVAPLQVRDGSGVVASFSF
jgi:membrane-associated phospholipid phosphatase